MNEYGLGRNDPCPCGSGRKHKKCCLRGQSNEGFPGFGYLPATLIAASPPAEASNGPSRRFPLPPDLPVKVFRPERRQWHDAFLQEVKPGQEFIAGSCLYRLHSAAGASQFPEIDIAKIAEADRAFDPANWRPPRAQDVVCVVDKLTDPSAPFHRQLCEVEPGQRFLFQGRTYTLQPHESGSGYRVVLDEEDSPKEKALYVWLEYTIQDVLGKAEVSYRYPLGQRIPLVGGVAVPVEDMAPDMVFHLEFGGVATVTKVGPPTRGQPNRVFRDPYGNDIRRVIGTYQFTGWVLLMTVTVGGEVHEVTPGHPYWSQTRQGWYPIGSFRVGELLLTEEKLPVPIEAMTAPRWVQETVYNVEVEEYHTYFVGRGKTSVWVHNGMGDLLGCGVPKAEREGSGKKAGAGRAGLSEDPKFAAGYEAIFGKKPSGVNPKRLGVSGSTQPEIFEGTVRGMRQAMRSDFEGFWRRSVRRDGPVKVLVVESLGNQRILENGNHRFQAALAEGLPIPDWAHKIEQVKTWAGPIWPLDQQTWMPGTN